MVVGAGLLYLAYLLTMANAADVKVDFLIGRMELATWQALGLSFFAGAGLVGLYTLYQMARSGLVRRRYQKELAGLETEVHQLRNLPLAPEESAAGNANDVDFEDELARERGGKGA
jgi:uncharacterized integral membrane protein